MPNDDLCKCGCGQPRRTDSPLLAMDGRMFTSLFATPACERRWAWGLAICPNCGKDFSPSHGGRLTGTELVCSTCYDIALGKVVA